MSGAPVMRNISAVELVCVVAILGIVGAIALPRFGRASESGPETQLRDNLRLLRIGIARFHAEHGYYPAQRDAGDCPAGTPEAFLAHLTGAPVGRSAGLAAVADLESGPETQFSRPYLRDGVPPCPVAPCAGASDVAILVDGRPEPPHAAWCYDPQTGEIHVNSEHCDGFGRAYASY